MVFGVTSSRQASSLRGHGLLDADHAEDLLRLPDWKVCRSCMFLPVLILESEPALCAIAQAAFYATEYEAASCASARETARKIVSVSQE